MALMEPPILRQNSAPVSYIMAPTSRAAKIANTGSKYVGFSQMALMLAGLAGGAGSWMIGKEEKDPLTGKVVKQNEGVLPSIGRALAAPTRFLGKRVDEIIGPKGTENIGGAIGTVYEKAGGILNLKGRAAKAVTAADERIAKANRHQLFTGSAAAVPDLVGKMRDLSAQYQAAAEADKAGIKTQYDTAKTEFDTAVGSLKKQGTAFWDNPVQSAKDWFHNSKVDSAVGGVSKALDGKDIAIERQNFAANPIEGMKNRVKNMTAGEVVNGAIQAGIVISQGYGEYRNIKDSGKVIQQMYYDMTGQHISLSKLAWQAKFNKEALPPFIRKEANTWVNNSLFGTGFFLGGNYVRQKALNKLQDTSMGSNIAGNALSSMLVMQGSSMLESFVKKPSMILPIYQQLHMMEHLGHPLPAASILDLVVATSPQLQAKGGHMSMNAQLVARYFEATGASVSTIMKEVSKGENRLMEISHIAREELINKPQRAYEMQQQASLEQQPQGKWANMVRGNQMQAQRGGKFAEMVTESAGTEMFRRA